jgi:shikimate kinase
VTRHIVLVGLPGAGKTSVGKAVAQELGGSFVDADHLIEERVQASISEIFMDRGES